MGRQAKLDLEQLKPFGRAIMEFLYDQRPNWPVTRLADEAGLSSQAIWDWIRDRAVPEINSLKKLYKVMEEHAYHLEGQLITLEMLCELAEVRENTFSPWHDLAYYIKSYKRIPQEARSKLILFLQGIEKEYH